MNKNTTAPTGVVSSTELGAWSPIETAPRDGSVIGTWNPKEPGIVRFAKWAHHLSNPRYGKSWCSVTKSLAMSNLPTHWVRIEAPNIKVTGA